MHGVPNAEHALWSSDNDRRMPRMTTTMRLSYLAIVLPYAAVLLGLHVLRNAWATIFLYHVGMVTLLRLVEGGRRLRRWSSGSRLQLVAFYCFCFGARYLVSTWIWRKH